MSLPTIHFVTTRYIRHKNMHKGQAVVAHTFNLGTQKAGQVDLWFEDSLVYRVNSRTARAAQRNPDSRKKTNKLKKLSVMANIRIPASTRRVDTEGPGIQGQLHSPRSAWTTPYEDKHQRTIQSLFLLAKSFLFVFLFLLFQRHDFSM